MKLHDTLAASCALTARKPNHEWHLEQLIIESIGALEKFTMVSQRMAMVSQQEDDRIIIVAQVFEGPEEPAQAVIHKGGLPGVQALDVTDFLCRRPIPGLTAHWQNQSFPAIAWIRIRVKTGWRVPRLVRVERINLGKETRVDAVAPQPVNGLVYQLCCKPIFFLSKVVGIRQELRHPAAPYRVIVLIDVVIQVAFGWV